MNTFSQANRNELERRSRDAAQTNLEPSKTVQGPAHDADINNIAKAYGLNGRNMPIPPAIFDPANYADLSEVPSLQDALNLVHDANDQFARLPADLRAMFNHDPAQLWEFVQDPRNGPKAVELGLLAERPSIVAPDPLAPPTNATPG